jgi:hypothetical protein
MSATRKQIVRLEALGLEDALDAGELMRTRSVRGSTCGD